MVEPDETEVQSYAPDAGVDAKRFGGDIEAEPVGGHEEDSEECT